MAGFEFGTCPNLIDCVLAASSEATKAGMAAGTSIAALIPTSLVLVDVLHLLLCIDRGVTATAMTGFPLILSLKSN